MNSLRLLLAGLLILNGQFIFTQTNTLVLQPGPDCGKDVTIWYLQNASTRWGNVQERRGANGDYLCIAEWTWSLVPGRRWVLLDFLSDIQLPQDLEITAARLSLYSPHEPTADDFHSSYQVRRKHPIGLVQRVLEPWEEQQVNWYTRPASSLINHVVLPTPKSVQDDFVDIDVTAMVQDMLAKPGQNHGFLIRMRDEDRYRKLIFASSDYHDPALRPRLEIDYRGPRIEVAIPADCQPPVDCTPVFAPVFDKRGRSSSKTYYPEIPASCELIDYHVRIYNGSGEEMFHGVTPTEGWDGLAKGMPQPQGQYSVFCTNKLEGEDELQTLCRNFQLLMPRP